MKLHGKELKCPFCNSLFLNSKYPDQDILFFCFTCGEEMVYDDLIEHIPKAKKKKVKKNGN